MKNLFKILILSLFTFTFGQQIEWIQSYGGIDDEYGESGQKTSDGGYIVLGKNNQHLWLFKTDQNGIQEWSQLFGDTSEVSIGNSLIQIY